MSSKAKQIQIACRQGRVLTAPLQGTIVLDKVSVAPADDFEAIERAIGAALRMVPKSNAGWEQLGRSRSPFQKAEGIRTNRDFERGLRLMLLISSEDKIALERFVPYSKGRSGFVVDDQWTRVFPGRTPLKDVARCVAQAFSDHTWPTR